MNSEPTTDRDDLDRIADSFVTRFRDGQRPSIEEYARRYPEHAEQLRELLPALVLLETATPDDTAAFGKPKQSATLPTEIGEFTIVREIARGGMGIVYEAVQQSLGRHVALKVLLSPGLLNPTHLERFRLEARAAARLHHSHIVPVFGVGEHNGLHYYAMQFIQGQSLDLVIDALRQLRHDRDNRTSAPGNAVTRAMAESMLSGHFQADDPVVAAANATACDTLLQARTPSTPSASIIENFSALSHSTFTSSHGGREFYRSVARVGLQVAEALTYAHSEGILHRDIKPSNLLLDAKGNVWVTDFGLARDESTDGLTRTGDFVGTLRYMPPERLEGWSDRRSDIYSLGATLYELLTLRPFLESASRGQLVDKILHESPSSPSKSDPAIPRDLETLVLKAIGKEPASRYRTAEAMAEDLRRFLADRSILARRSSPREQFFRWCRRSPLVASLTGVVVALLATAVAILWVSNARIRAEANAKESALQHSTAEAARSRQIAQFMREMLEGVGPGAARGQDTTLLRGILDQTAGRLGAELRDQPELEAELRETLGIVYRDLGEYASAADMLEMELVQLRKLHGDEHLSVARASHHLADVYRLQGLNLQAEAAFRDALAMRRKLLGAEHPDVADSLYGLAEVLRRDESTRLDAETMHREALAMRRKLQGDDQLALADSLAALGILMRNFSGRESEGETFLREALAIRQAELGPEHPQVAYTLSNLGYLMKAVPGKQVEGESIVRQAIDIQKRVLGDHRDTAMSLHFLASMVADPGEAEKLHRETLAMRSKVLGDGHADTTVSLSRLADVLVKQGKFTEAAELYGEEADRIRKQQGKMSTSSDTALNTAQQINRLGQQLRSAGNLAEAETSFRRALALYNEVYDGDHERTAEVLRRLAQTLLEQGKPTEAEPIVLQAIAMLNNVVGKDDPLLAIPYEVLGSTLKAQGNLAAAETSFRKCIATGYEAGWAYVELAHMLAQKGNWKEVETFSRKAAEYYKVQDKSTSTINYHDQLTLLRKALKEQGKQTEAKELLSEVYERGDPESFDLLVTWAAEDGDWTNAAESFALLSEQQPDSIDTLYYLALARAMELANRVGLNDEERQQARELIRSAIEANAAFAARPARGQDVRATAVARYIQLLEALSRNPMWNEEVALIGEHLSTLLEDLLSESSHSLADRASVGHRLRTWAFTLPWNEERNSSEIEQIMLRAVDVFHDLTVDYPEAHQNWHFLADTNRCLGDIYARQARRDDAELVYRRAVELFGQYRQKFPDVSVNESERAASYFSLASVLSQTDSNDEVERLYQLGSRALEGALTTEPAQVQSYYLVGLSRARAADGEGYRDVCATMLKRFPTLRDDSERDRFAWTFVLCPDAVQDFSLPLKTAEEVVAKNPQNAGYLATLGAVYYRLHQFEQAESRLRDSIAAFENDRADLSSSLYPQLFAAMNQWQLGNKDEARRLLADASSGIDEALVAFPPWNRQATLELLRREAEALMQIEGSHSDTPTSSEQNPAGSTAGVR